MNDYLKKLFDDSVTARIEVSGKIIRIEEADFIPAEVLGSYPGAYASAFKRWQGQRKELLLHKADKMLEIGTNRQRFHSLQQAFSNGTVTAFVGAGMSRPSGFQLWGEFLDGLKAESNVDEDRYRRCSSEAKAQLIAQTMSADWLCQQLYHRYQTFNQEVKGAVHYLPRLFQSGIVTTNFDDILEYVYTLSDLQFPHVLLGRRDKEIGQRLGRGDRFLFKLHGHYSLPESRVFLRSEYDAAYRNKHFLFGLRLLFDTRTLLFLGCSLEEDRTMKCFAKWQREEPSTNPHYAFLALPQNNADKVRREVFLSKCRIAPIWYDPTDRDESICALFEKLLDGGS